MTRAHTSTPSPQTTAEGGRADAPQAAQPQADGHPILRIQRTVGNQALASLLRTSLAQAKLTVSQPGDPLERDADAAADALVRSLAAGPAATPAAPTAVQRVGAGADASARGDAPAAVPDDFLEPLGAGEPLDPALRAQFEPRLGVDLDGVRVHADGAAAASAASVDALAYTAGRHVVFGAAQYAPHTSRGLHLLGHELAHVAQQARDATPRVDRFEARVHQGAERYGLTTSTGRGALTNEEATAVHFGNWMRDMNQVFVPLVTGMLPPDVVFSMMSYLAARTFGREMTPEQFGYYIPAEHIDNPAGLVARDDLWASQPPVTAAVRPQAPARLGAPRPPARETLQEDVSPTSGTVAGVNIFDVDQTAVMAFIRRTNLHIERRLQLAADTGRTPDGMHHFGAALHAVEDLLAHSNYVEIAVDRLLRTDRSFLRGLTGTARQVFTYAPQVAVGGGPGRRAEQRPVLTTGSFTGSDTQVSIASELVGFMARPLPAPATEEERRAQERFVIAMLRAFEARLRASPDMQRTLTRALERGGVPPALAGQAHRVPLADTYERLHILIPFPEVVREVKQEINNVISREVLQPAAGQLQAAALEARIRDTSLIKVLRESQRQQSGRFTPAEREMMTRRQQLTGEPVEQQQAATRAAGGRRAQAIQATPTTVVAGPSHSQIGKDHPNSPFFGLAFRLATVAVQRLRDRMLAAWVERDPTAGAPFDFSWSIFPQPAPAGTAAGDVPAYDAARGLYHACSERHTRRHLRAC